LQHYNNVKEKISITINEKILKDIDSIIDNIFIRNRSQAIEYLIKKATKDSKTAVILADNKESSTRLKNRFALKINRSTIIEKAVRKLENSGFKNIFIISDHDTLTNIFKIIGDGTDFNVKIEYIDEEIPEGSASALKLLRNKIKTTFLVVACDIIFDSLDLLSLWQQHLQEKVIATMIVNSSIIISAKKTMFGHVKLEGKKIISYIEKPLIKNLKSTIFFGSIFVAEPEIFSHHGKSLEVDIFPELARKGLLGGQMCSSEHLHIHSYEDLTAVRKKLAGK